MLLLCSACAAAGMPGTVSLALADATPVTASSAVRAVLRNATDHTVDIGNIRCGAEFDRLDGSTWTMLPRDHYCIDLSTQLPSGAEYGFSLTSPSQPGTYRIRVYVEGLADTSPSFVVQ